MIKTTKRGRPPKVVDVSPAAESGHNLFLQLERMAALIAAIDERTKRLESAVVPPRSLSDRAKSFVGL